MMYDLTLLTFVARFRYINSTVAVFCTPFYMIGLLLCVYKNKKGRLTTMETDKVRDI